MITNIICLLLACLGIYGFFIDNIILLSIGSIATIIECIIGLYTNKLKSVGTYIFFSIIGIIITKEIWIGISIGLCFENVILSIIGWFVIIIMTISNRNKEENPKKLLYNETLTMMKETLYNAQNDLNNSISEEEVDQLYNNGSFSDEDYIKIKNNYASLKTIISSYPSMIEQVENDTINNNIFRKEN